MINFFYFSSWKITAAYTFFLQIPHSVEIYALDIGVKTGRAKLKEEFVRNMHVKDIRVIDMLVIKVKCGDTDSLWGKNYYLISACVRI